MTPSRNKATAKAGTVVLGHRCVSKREVIENVAKPRDSVHVQVHPSRRPPAQRAATSPPWSHRATFHEKTPHQHTEQRYDLLRRFGIDSIFGRVVTRVLVCLILFQPVYVALGAEIDEGAVESGEVQEEQETSTEITVVEDHENDVASDVGDDVETREGGAEAEGVFADDGVATPDEDDVSPAEADNPVVTNETTGASVIAADGSVDADDSTTSGIDAITEDEPTNDTDVIDTTNSSTSDEVPIGSGVEDEESVGDGDEGTDGSALVDGDESDAENAADADDVASGNENADVREDSQTDSATDDADAEEEGAGSGDGAASSGGGSSSESDDADTEEDTSPASAEENGSDSDEVTAATGDASDDEVEGSVDVPDDSTADDGSGDVDSTTVEDGTFAQGATSGKTGSTTADVSGEVPVASQASSSASTTQPTIVGMAIDDTNKYIFGEGDCTLVADGEFYCVADSPQKQMTGDPRVYAEKDRQGDREIYYFDGIEVVRITNNSYDDFAPVFDDLTKRIVWQANINDRLQIMYHEIPTNTTRQVTESRQNSSNPHIQGDLVVWQEWVDTNWEVYMINIDTPSTFELERLTDNAVHDMFPQMYDNLLTWQRERGDSWEVIVYDLRTGIQTALEKSEDTRYENPRFVLLFDSKHDNGDVETIGYDLDTGEMMELGTRSRPIPDDPVTPDDETQEALPREATSTPQVKVKVDDSEGDTGTSTPNGV